MKRFLPIYRSCFPKLERPLFVVVLALFVLKWSGRRAYWNGAKDMSFTILPNFERSFGIIRRFWSVKHMFVSTCLYGILNLLKAITHGIRLVYDLENRIAHWGLMQ